jgi:hypothetical protein
MDITTQINYPELEILKYYDSSLWNQLNIDKVTPLELLVELDYNIYSNIIIENKIAINPDLCAIFCGISKTPLPIIEPKIKVNNAKYDNSCVLILFFCFVILI